MYFIAETQCQHNANERTVSENCVTCENDVIIEFSAKSDMYKKHVGRILDTYGSRLDIVTSGVLHVGNKKVVPNIF